MSLVNLPAEILEYIIEISSRIEKKDDTYFIGWPYPEHSYDDLKSIALTCRQLYIRCAPYLWKDKEFILPREDDKRGEMIVDMATDILSQKGLFQQHRLGDYIRSLYRNLSNSVHYTLDDSILMAQLVSNLKALRIDFHPRPRKESYGLGYFAHYCPYLSELYLTNCRDTFDDFLSLYECQVQLCSLTLINCTIKEVTLHKLSVLLKKPLDKLLLQELMIEPISPTISHVHLMDNSLLHPFHYHHLETGFPLSAYNTLMDNHQNLTELALKDPISCSIIHLISRHSPLLKKLSISIKDTDPYQLSCAVLTISRLSHLVILSLEFSRYYYTRNAQLLPCHASSRSWSILARSLPLLRILTITTARLLVNTDFLILLMDHHPLLNDIMIHNITLTTYHTENNIIFDNINDHNNEEHATQIMDIYRNECQHIIDTPSEWEGTHVHSWNVIKNYISTQSESRWINCHVDHHRMCLIKGFSDHF